MHAKGIVFPPNRDPSSFRFDVQTVLYAHDSDAAIRADVPESIDAETGLDPHRCVAVHAKKPEKTMRKMTPLALKVSLLTRCML